MTEMSSPPVQLQQTVHATSAHTQDHSTAWSLVCKAYCTGQQRPQQEMVAQFGPASLPTMPSRTHHLPLSPPGARAAQSLVRKLAKLQYTQYRDAAAAAQTYLPGDHPGKLERCGSTLSEIHRK